MANTILITANWHTGALSQQTISRQYDNNRYVVQFVGYPEASDDNELDYYLLVWMSSAPGEKPDEIAPIQLASDQWYISNVFTQQTQQIKFQMCALNTEGTFEAHSPIFTGFVRNSLEHDGTTQDIDVSTLFDAYREYLNELIIRAGAVVIDPTLSQSGQAADAEAAGKVKNGLNTIIYGGDYDYPIAWIDGYYINNNTGEAEVYTNWICTDFIEIDPNTIVKTTTTATNGTGYNAFYSDNKSFLQKFTNANSALTIPNNAKYMRLSCRKIEKVTVSFAMQSGMIDFNGCLAEQGDEW